LALTEENRQQVEAFYRTALEAGGTENGALGLRPHYHTNYYTAFVISPDGHNIEWFVTNLSSTPFTERVDISGRSSPAIALINEI